MSRGARLAFVLMLALAGCSGGGHSSAVAPVPDATAAASGLARFTLLIPATLTTSSAARKPAYVSSSTLSGTIAANGGTPAELDLGVASPLCTAVSGGRSCAISIPAAIGANDTFAIVLYNGAYTAGVHTGVALSAAANFVSPVVEGTANVATPLVLGGIPAQVDVLVATLTANVANTVAMIVTAYDASGNVIVGPGTYADATGAAAPLTIGLTQATAQVTLHDGAQSGAAVTVAGPTDVLTFTLNAPATILGETLTAKNHAGTTLARRNYSRAATVSGGTLTTTLMSSSITFQPDNVYLAPANALRATGVPNGFAFSIEATGSGVLGYFNSSTETFDYCTVSAFTLGVTPIANGLVTAYNGADNIDTPPLGVTYWPLAALSGGACAGGSAYRTDQAGGSFARSLIFDEVGNLVFAGTQSDQLRYDTFASPTTLSGDTMLASYSTYPNNLIALHGNKFFLASNSQAVYNFTNTNTPATSTASSGTLMSLAATNDDTLYALDSSNRMVWKYAGGPSLVAYTPANAITITPVTRQYNLAIGPDGLAYTTDGASTVQGVSTAGATSTAVIPPPSGNLGYLDAIFDGQNGFLYAYYDDGLHAGKQYVYRISY